MSLNLNEEITDFSVLSNRYIIRDGYIFTSWNDQPNVFNVLVIKSPKDADTGTKNFPDSSHSLEEHIDFVGDEKIERATIIASDIAFIEKCPSLKSFSVFPANSTLGEFDYAPLYHHPNVEYLSCQTVYGEQEQLSCSIDYSKVNGLKKLGVYGKGHLNYALIESLESLWLSNTKQIENTYQVSNSSELKELTVLQCSIKSLNGIERYRKLESLDLSYNRLLSDISMLSEGSETLRLLNIEGCAKITDFSFLHEMTNLEHLALLGSNVLPDLNFLRNMKKLKTFIFSMEIVDGDLTDCLNIPYVSCIKNKKWYNLKDKQLPKNKPTKPFKISVNENEHRGRLA